MDDYPSGYVAHSRPLVLLSGFNAKLLERDGKSLISNGLRIASDIPPVNNSLSHSLEAAFLKFDPGDVFSNESSESAIPLSSMVFRFKSCGREYTLPCRKASPAAAEVGSPIGSPGSSALRSPFSPLSHGSVLHPDGLMSPLWPMKYLDAIPSVLVSVFSIGFDPQNDVLNDNRLKTEIHMLKNSLADSHYGIALAVVLLADKSMEQCLSTDERLANIRKAAKLENKTTFFYLPPSAAHADFKPFAVSVLSGIRPICMDFYKNHYKKSRRKKDKSVDASPSTPTTEGISQKLPKAGWTIRSEFKMALFSEFRFEMDAAARHHKEVIDLMMESGGLFDLYPFWSSRWNELRLFADTTAIRRIRCLLANGQTSSAARFWRIYHSRTKQLLERKGKGTSTYGWKAWEARFAQCMAQTILSMFFLVMDTSARKTLEVISRKQTSAYVPPEKSVQSELLAPFDYLHHPGFWLSLSAKHLEARRVLAQRIPAEDLIPPGQSPAAQVAKRNEAYDTFLCSDPHVEGTSYDHKGELIDLLEKAHVEFAERGQPWMADKLRLHISSIADTPLNTKADALRKAWAQNKWRGLSWIAIIKEIATKAHMLAKEAGDFQTQIQTAWELLNSHLGMSENIICDVEKLLNEAYQSQNGQSPASYDIKIIHEETISFLNINFCFEKESENLGEPLRAQLCLHSNAHKDSTPVSLSSVLVVFNGNAPDVRIVHLDSGNEEDAGGAVSKISLKDETRNAGQLTGKAPLTIYPQETKVFTLNLSMREPGKVSAAKAFVRIERPSVNIEYSKNLGVEQERGRWYILRNGVLSSQRLYPHGSHQEIDVLPKLPKLKIHLPEIVDKYYVGERISLQAELVNEETDEIKGSVEIRLTENSRNDGAFVKVTETLDETAKDEDLSEATLADSYEFGALAPLATEKKSIVLQMPNIPSEDLTLEFEARYLQTGGDSESVSKTMSAKILIAEPFRTTFAVSPDWHPAPWPSFFDLKHETSADNEESETDSRHEPRGISSRWNFNINIASLADTDLTVEKVELDLHNVSEGAIANTKPTEKQDLTLGPGEDTALDMLIDITKEEMEDMSPTTMNPALRVYWRRANSDNSRRFQKFIPAPRMNLSGSEPRVIATLGKSTEEAVEIFLHLENPSLHYLSFEIGIEPNDDFAFSGPKLGDVHLVPYSRRTVPFVLVPLVRGTWIQAVFKVVDVYFNKSLRINAGSGVKREPGTGALLIWAGS